MSLLDALEVPAARSRASTSPTRRPRVAASSAAPAPVIPPPTTSTSSSPETAASIATRRAEGSRSPPPAPTSASVEEGPQRRVEPAVPAMQLVVDAVQLRVGLHGLAARAGHRRRGLGDARVHPR